MASNSLRGGKNIYGPQTLCSNWQEERFEPHRQSAAQESSDQLPSKSAKTWSRTADDHGEEHREAMQKALSTETRNWLKYQREEVCDMYKTTSGDSFCHPDAQVPPLKGPSCDEAKLEEYRAAWTRTGSAQFEKQEVGGGGEPKPPKPGSYP